MARPASIEQAIAHFERLVGELEKVYTTL
jgi:hypothetical protein